MSLIRRRVAPRSTRQTGSQRKLGGNAQFPVPGHWLMTSTLQVLGVQHIMRAIITPNVKIMAIYLPVRFYDAFYGVWWPWPLTFFTLKRYHKLCELVQQILYDIIVIWTHRCITGNTELEVCALCGDADPRRVCRELHFVWRAVLEDLTWNTSIMGGRTLVLSDWNAAGAPAAMQHSFLL